MYEFGKIILIPFPFTDLTSTKVRPALIISKAKSADDIIVAFISSKPEKTHNSIPLKVIDSCFRNSGLKVDSCLRLDKIATLNKKIALGEIGEIPVTFLSKHKRAFYNIFGF